MAIRKENVAVGVRVRINAEFKYAYLDELDLEFPVPTKPMY